MLVWSDDSRSIAYVTHRDPKPLPKGCTYGCSIGELHFVNRNGSADRLLTSIPGDLVLERYTHGSVFAFHTGEGGYVSGLTRISARNGSIRNLTPDLGSFDPRRVALSPDGSTLYYVRYRNHVHYSIIRRVLNTGRQTILYATPSHDRTKGAIQIGQLVLSPSGSDLMFARSRDIAGPVTTMKLSVTGGKVSTLLTSPAELIPRSWSPDGHYVWMEPLCGDCTASAYVMDADSGRLSPAYQTDSTAIAVFVGWLS